MYTVKQLIEALSKFDENADVTIVQNDWWSEVLNVEFNTEENSVLLFSE